MMNDDDEANQLVVYTVRGIEINVLRVYMRARRLPSATSLAQASLRVRAW